MKEIIYHNSRGARCGQMVKTRRTACKYRPGAAKIVKVSGGYMAFDSMVDYRLWLSQI